MQNLLTYAIGDIHGCFDLLVSLLQQISEDRPGMSRRLVFLGDYIDRGPASKSVIYTLRKLQMLDPESVVCLAGNHEDMLLRAFHDRDHFLYWLQNGGQPTLASYNVNDLCNLPLDDIAWIARLPTLYEDTYRYYVHAGLRPGAPVEPEERRVRLWARTMFLAVDHDFGKHVVHGHTPQRSGRPELRRYRTNLDTAAVYGATLTAGVFKSDVPGGPIDIIQVTENTCRARKSACTRGAP